MKRVNAITFLNTLVGGVLSLLIPLILLSKHVKMAEIGVDLSAVSNQTMKYQPRLLQMQ
jgi:hypothetical protein